MGDYAATYTTIEGKILPLSHEYMGLPFGSESSSEVALCSTTGLSFQTPSIGFNGVENGGLGSIDVVLDAPLCRTGRKSVVKGTVVFEITTGSSTTGQVVPGWTVTGDVEITSYVKHKPGDPPPSWALAQTPSESVEGTFAIQLHDDSGHSAELALGTFSLDVTTDTLSDSLN
jgi:hypothetical protein